MEGDFFSSPENVQVAPCQKLVAILEFWLTMATRQTIILITLNLNIAISCMLDFNFCGLVPIFIIS